MSSSPASRRPRILMVCTRPIASAAESGREKTMRLIHDALAEAGEVEVLVLPSFLQARSLGGALHILGAWLSGLATGRRLPLQSLLFWHPRHARTIAAAVARNQPDAVYFDGVRTGIYLPGLRALLPGLRLVCDFDDLMSRRMAHLAAERQPVSLGYLAKYVPVWIARQIIQPLAATTIPRYEAGALQGLEWRIVAAADAVVLVSSTEAAALRAELPAAQADRIVVIPPGMPATVACWPADHVERFVFVGADSLLQNRRTIEALVALWTHLKPALSLHLYGRQRASYGTTPGIVVHGFVEDIAEAYGAGSLMLAPSFVSGGVKTKVLEAFAHGAAVVGTAMTFEGIAAPTAALVRDADGLARLVNDPAGEAPAILAAAREAIVQARLNHASARLGAAWCVLVWPNQLGT